MKFLGFVLMVGLAVFAWRRLHPPIEYPPGILIASEPEQTRPTSGPIQRGDFTLKPLAHFSLRARVLHRKVYRLDKQSRLAPIDLALGWGRMSDQRVLDQVRISQSMRFYWFEYKMPAPLPKDEIISHSTNVHVIPATAEIGAECKSLRAGSLVYLSGDLVEATAPGFDLWRSSVSRTDTGYGACELMLVREVSILPGPAPLESRGLASR